METDDSDLPPESIVVPITEDTPWQYSAYDSGDSGREITNPKSHSNPFPRSKTGLTSSQVAATNLKATARSPIISIPTKFKLSGFAHNHGPASIFPRWHNSKLKKSGLADNEPGSPKVSCWGKVLSEREKEKLRKQREARKELEKAPSCCSRFSAMMTCVGDPAAGRRGDSHFQLAEVNPRHVEDIRQPSEMNIVSEFIEVPPRQLVEVEAEAVGLGDLKRFSSARRAESWGADLDDEKEGIAVVAQENSSN
jgi:hypothetical protein